MWVSILVFCGALISPFLTQAANYKTYVVIAEADYGEIVISDGYDFYLLDYGYGCYGSDFSVGETIWIDAFLYPSFYDEILVHGTFDYKTCNVTSAEELDLEDYYVHAVDGYDVILEDEWGDLYSVELGAGCSSIWLYEDKWVTIDTSYLDGYGDTMYLLDRGDSCSLWSVEEISTSSSYSYIDPAAYANYTCQLQYGAGSYGSGDSCYCSSGYMWNSDMSSCVVKTTCPANSYLGSDNSCYCNEGSQISSDGTSCEIASCANDEIMRNGQCLTHTENCKEEFGSHTYGEKGPENNSSCYCSDGYAWNSSKTACELIPESVIDDSEEIIPGVSEGSNLADLGGKYDIAKHDKALITRLLGNILLQVEENGEAWYLNPTDSERYYMRNGSVAYEMMRSFGLGITDADLEKIPSAQTVEEMKNTSSVCSTNNLANRLKGQILLQVEQHGEAWYIDTAKCKKIYMKDGDEAYSMMRYLSLGILNADLEKIPTGDIE